MGAHNSTEIGVVVDDGSKEKGVQPKAVVPISMAESRILFKSTSINDQDRNGNTSLHNSIKRGDVGAAQQALAQGADVNIQNQGGCTALHVAAKGESVDMIQLLMEGEMDEGEIDLNIHNDDGLSPLHVAIMEDNAQSVMYLLQKGANVLGKTADGQTPLELAICNSNVSAAQVLCQVLQEKLYESHGKVEQVKNEMYFLNAIRSFQFVGMSRKYQDDVGYLHDKVNSLIQDKQVLKSQVRQNCVRFISQVCQLRQKQQLQEQAVQQLSFTNQNLKEQSDMLKQAQRDLLQSLELCKSQLLEAQAANDGILLDKVSLDQVKESLQGDIKNLRSELCHCKLQLQEAQSTNVQILSDKLAADQANEVLNEDIKQLRKELIQCKNGSDMMNNLLGNMQQAVEDLQEQIVEMVTNEGQHISDKYQLQLCNQRYAARNLELSTEVGELQAMVQDLQKLYQAKQQESVALNRQTELLSNSQQGSMSTDDYDQAVNLTSPNFGQLNQVYMLGKENLNPYYSQEQVQWLLDDRKRLLGERNQLCSQLEDFQFRLFQQGIGMDSLQVSGVEMSEFQDSNNVSTEEEQDKSGSTIVTHNNQQTPRSMLIHSDSDDYPNKQTEELKTKLQELCEENTCLNEQLEFLAQERNEIEQNNKDMLEEVKHLREHYDEMQFENVQLKHEVKELLEKQSEEVLDKRVLARTPSLYKELSGQYDSKIKQLESKVQSLKAELLCKEEQHSQNMGSSQDVELLDLQNQVVEQILSAGLKFAKEEMVKLRSEVEQIGQENETLKGCNDKLQQQLCCLQADLDDSERNVVQLKQVQKLLEEGNCRSHKDNCSLREEIRQLKAENAQISVEMEQDAVYYDDSKKEMQREIQLLQDDVKLKDSKLVQFEDMNRELQERVNVIAEQVQENKQLQEEVDCQVRKVEELERQKQHEVEQQLKEVNELQKENQKYVDKNIFLEQENVKLQQSIAHFKDQENKLKDKLEDALQQKIQKQRELEELELIVDETEEAVQQFQEENRKIQIDMNNMQEVLEQLETEKHNYEGQVIELQDMLQQLRKENQDINEKISGLNVFIEDLSEKNSFPGNNKEGLIDKLRWFMEAMNKKVTDVESHKADIQQRNNALMKNMEGVCIQFGELQKTRDRQAQQIQQYQQQIEALQMDNAEPQQQFERVTELENELQQMQSKVAELQVEREYLQHDKEDLQNQMEQQISGLKAKHEEQIKALQTSNKRTKNSEDQELQKNYKKIMAENERTSEANKMIMEKLVATERDVENLRELNDNLLRKIKNSNSELQKAQKEQRKLFRICSKAEESRDLAQKENEKLLSSVQQNMQEVNRLMLAVQEFKNEKQKPGIQTD